MSAPESLDRARADGWDDSPVRCCECGSVYSLDDGDFISTACGPVCRLCGSREGVAPDAL